MTKRCIICKAEPTPISHRSFHVFPKNESLRKRWLDAINVSKTPNFKTAYVCSDHFDEESYFCSDEYRQRMRLRPEAVPKKKNPYSILPLAENIENYSVMNSVDTCEGNVVKEEVITRVNANGETVMCKNEVCSTNPLHLNESHVFKDIGSQPSSQPHPDVKIEMGADQVPLRNSLDVEESNGSPEDCNSETEKSAKPQNEHTSNNSSNSRRRKKLSTNIRPVKKVRFMNGFKTEYVCQEDFVNDEAWTRFLRFLSYQKSKTTAAYNRTSRKAKKIQKLKGVIDSLNREKEFDAAEC